ncbi:unnamed protein product [Caenorhabditis nigoni]
MRIHSSKSSLARQRLKAGDVVWAGAYLGLLIRKKNTNRWVVEYSGISNQTGSGKIDNIVAFHVGDYIPCINDEDTPATKRSNIRKQPIKNGDPCAAVASHQASLKSMDPNGTWMTILCFYSISWLL